MPLRRSAGHRLKTILHEPLVHFLAIGFLLFVAGTAWQRHHDRYRIEITRDRVAQIAETWRKQYGAAPAPAVLERLVQDDIDNEMLYREGVSLRLDHEDEIVRRRVIQKMRFLAEDLSAPAEPTDTAIEAWYRAHADLYARPSSVSFTHVYFSADGRGDAEAEDRARAALAQLAATDRLRAPGLGDPFPDLHDFARFGREQVERLFGRTPFSQAVFDAPIGQWVGPYRSGYGWHLLKVVDRSAPIRRPFAEVRDSARADLLADMRSRQNMAEFAALRRRFTVLRSDAAP